jgi:hypothetical protein
MNVFICLRYEFLAAGTAMKAVFKVLLPWSVVEIYEQYDGIYCCHFQGF